MNSTWNCAWINSTWNSAYSESVIVINISLSKKCVNSVIVVSNILFVISNSQLSEYGKCCQDLDYDFCVNIPLVKISVIKF